jgi:hypothetical protein
MTLFKAGRFKVLPSTAILASVLPTLRDEALFLQCGAPGKQASSCGV